MHPTIEAQSICVDRIARSDVNTRNLPLTHRRWRKAAFLFGVVALVSTGGLVRASPYTFLALDAFDSMGGLGRAVNDSGQIAGTTVFADGTAQATRWDSGARFLLPAPEGLVSEAYAINNFGQVAGTVSDTGGGFQRAVTWIGGVQTILGVLPGGSDNMAYAINDSGQIAGITSFRSATAFGRATLWNGNTATDLGTLGGQNSWAYGINNIGQVVGQSETSARIPHAALWTGTTATDLGTLGGDLSQAFDINDAGHVVGRSTIVGNLEDHATSWFNGIVTDLGTLGGNWSIAYSINNKGESVGFSLTNSGSMHATLWAEDGLIDLNTLLDDAAIEAGWILNAATSINDRGWITGMASNISHPRTSSFLLYRQDVPEPSTYWLILTGLVFIGYDINLGRRRHRPSRELNHDS